MVSRAVCVRGSQDQRAASRWPGRCAAAAWPAAPCVGRGPLPSSSTKRCDRQRSNAGPGMHTARLRSSMHSPPPHRLPSTAADGRRFFACCGSFSTTRATRAAHATAAIATTAALRACRLRICLLLCGLRQRICQRKPRQFSLKTAHMRAKRRKKSLALRGAWRRRRAAPKK